MFNSYELQEKQNIEYYRGHIAKSQHEPLTSLLLQILRWVKRDQILVNFCALIQPYEQQVRHGSLCVGAQSFLCEYAIHAIALFRNESPSILILQQVTETKNFARKQELKHRLALTASATRITHALRSCTCSRKCAGRSSKPWSSSLASNNGLIMNAPQRFFHSGYAAPTTPPLTTTPLTTTPPTTTTPLTTIPPLLSSPLLSSPLLFPEGFPSPPDVKSA